MKKALRSAWQHIKTHCQNFIEWWRWSDPRARGTEGESLRLEQQIFLVRTLPVFSGLNIFMGVVVTAVALKGASPLQVLPWSACVLMTAAITLFGWWHVKNKPAPTRVRGRNLRRAAQFSFLQGLIWGSLVTFMLNTPYMSLGLFAVFVIVVVMAGTVTLMNPIPSVCYAYILSTPVPAIVIFLFRDGPVRDAFVLTLIAYTLGLCFSTRLGYERFFKMVSTRNLLSEAREDLIDAIEWSPNAFALFSAEGRITLSNSTSRTFFPDGAKFIQSEFLREEQLPDGRWVRSSQRRTSRGGTVSVYVDISAMKEREDELRNARDAAHGANRSKSEFLTMMSHELRTPLNAVIGFSQLLATDRGAASDIEKVQDYAGAITDSGNHLLQVINDILDLSKVEAGRYEIFEDEVDVGGVINGAMRLLEQKALAADLHLSADVPADLPTLKADERTIRQMLLNLLSNAVKFTPRRGRVTVSARVRPDGTMAITVTDTGIGIAEEDMPRVFAPFGQVQNNLNRDRQGTGLGIPLVRRFINLHGGELEVESAPGKGTAAHLVFPPDRVINAQAAVA